MPGFTELYKDRILDYTFGNTASVTGLGTSGTLHVGLLTEMPDDGNGDGTGLTEVTGSGYARQPITGATFAGAADGAITSAANIVFGPAGASWGTVVGVAVFVAATGAAHYFYDDLPTSKAIDTNDSLTIPLGDFDVSIA